MINTSKNTKSVEELIKENDNYIKAFAAIVTVLQKATGEVAKISQGLADQISDEKKTS